jgi:hypothetical protein
VSQGSGSELEVKERAVNGAKTDAEMLLLEDYWYVFKNALRKSANVELACGDRFELHIRVQIQKIAR